MESVDANESVTADAEGESTEICMAESCPGRTVFSERDNPDGWIGTDLTVDVQR
ncbi:hypothetical protein [Salinarchaeum laminariae]|uniref:hypothetical protein n=1 Tax=Salinarchaeum laminariae TaxID=869888 RepID=UPI0020BFDB07|nr:hypothetical protein [Salinarchaeum laminariae]